MYLERTEKSVIKRTSPVLPFGIKNAALHQGEYSLTGSKIPRRTSQSNSHFAGSSMCTGYFLETETFKG